jgi:hypothetical protein
VLFQLPLADQRIIAQCHSAAGLSQL